MKFDYCFYCNRATEFQVQAVKSQVGLTYVPALKQQRKNVLLYRPRIPMN